MELTKSQKLLLVAFYRLTQQGQPKSIFEVGHSVRMSNDTADEIAASLDSDGLLEIGSYPMAVLRLHARERAREIFQQEGSGIAWSSEEDEVILELDEMVRARLEHNMDRPTTPKYQRVLPRLRDEGLVQLARVSMNAYLELQWEAAAIRRRRAAEATPRIPEVMPITGRVLAKVDSLADRASDSGIYKFTNHTLVATLIITGLIALVGYLSCQPTEAGRGNATGAETGRDVMASG